MSWVKHRDKLHEAALSSVKSISKIKTITSKNGIPQRPPAQNLATLTSAPRSSKDLPSWRSKPKYFKTQRRNNAVGCPKDPQSSKFCM